MLNELSHVLNLTRPLIGLDLETTGTNPVTSAICELALEIMRPGQPVKEYRTLINPLMPIPVEATRVHHITNKDVRDAPTFVQLAANLALGLVNCDFAGYSIRFDLAQLAVEFQRANIDWNYNTASVLDGYRLWQLVEGRTLTHAVERWLLPSDRLDGAAHTALWDVKMSTRVIAAQLHKCGQLPRDVRRLHHLCWPGWVDPEGKLRWMNGDLCFTFGEHRNKPLRLVPKRYLSWVISKDFSELVKTICQNALNGRYPTAPDESMPDEPV